MLSTGYFHVSGNYLWTKIMPDLFLLSLISGQWKYYKKKKKYTWHVVTKSF